MICLAHLLINENANYRGSESIAFDEISGRLIHEKIGIRYPDYDPTIVEIDRFTARKILADGRDWRMRPWVQFL